MSKTAFIFPGQASQYIGMAADLYAEFESVKILFEKASAILAYDLADVCFNGPEEKLKQTAYTQPAVFVHACALDAILKENDLAPDMAAGHSLGEYSALVSAGALDFESAMKAIALRSIEMQKDCDDNPGTMAAVMGLDWDKIVEVLNQQQGIVVPANFNCPGQVVIAGELNAVEKACDDLKRAGAKRAMIIPVGGAYHSPLMERSAAVMADYIEKSLDFAEFACPVYSNVSAKPLNDGDSFKRNLARQIVSPVLWHPIIADMHDNGVRRFIEIGPGKVLQGLAKKSIKNPDVEIIGVDRLEDLRTLLSEKSVSA